MATTTQPAGAGGTDQDAVSWRPELLPDLRRRREDERVLFVHPALPRWVLINASAAEVASRFDGVLSIRSLAERIAEETGASGDIIENDVLELAHSFHELGFLQSEEDRRLRQAPSFFITGAFVRITDACNLRCTQCYADSFGSLKSKKDELTGEEVRDLLREVRDLGGRTVTFSGGEPLLRPDMLDLIEFTHGELGLKPKLNTNGTLLLAPGTVERLAPIMEELQVSFDGPSAETHDAVRGRGSFESSLRGVREYLAAGGSESLIMTLTLMRPNIGIALEMPALVRSVGGRTVRYLNLVKEGRARGSWAESLCPTEEQLIAFYDELYFGEPDTAGIKVMSGLQGFYPQIPEGFRDHCFLCPVGMSPCITPQGDVYPCSMFERPAFVSGNIRSDGGLQGVVETGKLQEMREAMSKRPQQISECSSCDWRGFCQSGCAGMIQKENGSTRHPDRFCGVRDHLYSRLIFEKAGRRNSAVDCSCIE